MEESTYSIPRKSGGGVEGIARKTRKNEAKRYSDLERKFLSAKGINVALEAIDVSKPAS